MQTKLYYIINLFLFQVEACEKMSGVNLARTVISNENTIICDRKADIRLTKNQSIRILFIRHSYDGKTVSLNLRIM